MVGFRFFRVVRRIAASIILLMLVLVFTEYSMGGVMCLEYTISNLDSNQTYYIAVKSYNHDNPRYISAVSNGVSGKPTAAGEITIQWDQKDEPQLAGFLIYFDTKEIVKREFGNDVNPAVDPVEIKMDDVTIISVSNDSRDSGTGSGGGGGGCLIATVLDDLK